MNRPTTHFAPEPVRLSRSAKADATTMISVTALAGVSEQVRRAFGEKVLQQANRAAMLDIELIEDRDCFIPHATMTAFLAEIERRTGEPDLGLLLAPHLTLAGYGCWGEYVLAAQTLGEAVRRAMDSVGYHSRGDRMTVSIDGDAARLAYLSAARGRPGYAHVAVGAVSVMLDLCRTFATPAWKPLWVELDIARPPSVARFEDTFGKPVRFDAPASAVGFAVRLLDARRSRLLRRRCITIEDVARARLDPGSRNGIVGVVSAQVWAQVLAGSVSLDAAARALDVSTRTLQRELCQAGTDFRGLVNSARSRRALELLRGADASVTEISAELGYAAPAHFARAFRKAIGLSPHAYRQAAKRLASPLGFL